MYNVLCKEKYIMFYMIIPSKTPMYSK